MGQPVEVREQLAKVKGKLAVVILELTEIIKQMVELIRILAKVVRQPVDLIGTLLQLIKHLVEVMGQLLEVIKQLVEVMGQPVDVSRQMLKVRGQLLEVGKQLVKVMEQPVEMRGQLLEVIKPLEEVGKQLLESVPPLLHFRTHFHRDLRAKERLPLRRRKGVKVIRRVQTLRRLQSKVNGKRLPHSRVSLTRRASSRTVPLTATRRRTGSTVVAREGGGSQSCPHVSAKKGITTVKEVSKK